MPKVGMKPLTDHEILLANEMADNNNIGSVEKLSMRLGMRRETLIRRVLMADHEVHIIVRIKPKRRATSETTQAD